MDGAPQSPVAALFDAMADEYDLLEPWYEHLYARLHAIIVDALRRDDGEASLRVLDAGCGSGMQMALLGTMGHTAHGVDLAGRLLTHARLRLPAAPLTRADLVRLPYAADAFDAAICVGSTFSFLSDADGALRELARVLRPGGRLLLECEHKWSLDLGWTLVSALMGGVLGYGISLRAMARAFRAPIHAPISLPYPGYGTLRLFSGHDLRRRLEAAGFRWQRAWGVHSVTNLLPSTVLHRPRVPRGLQAVDRALRRLDTALTTTAPGRALANSLVVLAMKG